jgi:5-methylcytosine-specific restriction endonuclease McrA
MKTIYCSRSCQLAYIAKNGWESRRKKIIASCAYCGKDIIVPPSRFKYAKRVCCSRECRAKLLTGNGNPAFIHGNGRRIPYGKNWCSQRRKAIKRDNWTCQFCKKKTKKPRGLHVHHIIPAHTFEGDYERANHLSNLITLCIPCHEKAEKGKTPIQPKMF